jgi:dynein heavy chain 1
VQTVLGEDIASQTPIDMLTFVNVNVNAKSPLIMVSAPGYDASYKIELLAKQANKKYTSVAIGSPEAFGLVDQAIRNASKSGNWVLLKNVHLAPQWLTELEKKIYSMSLEPNFRLFLTMENNPKVPATLIRASHVMIFEPPSGIKAALMRSYTNTITAQRTDKEPIERKRLHFIVSWFNAVV